MFGVFGFFGVFLFGDVGFSGKRNVYEELVFLFFSGSGCFFSGIFFSWVDGFF